MAVVACQLLDWISTPNVSWLSNDGQVFPAAIEKFITSVAWHFHHFSGFLPKVFLDELVNYIKHTQSHIATLNYDNLLYQSLIDADILRGGYSGRLVDGFWASGFKADNLERKQGKTFGYYLHLHGSPLFVNRGETAIKQSQRSRNEDIPSPHLVLSHVRHKKSLIASSSVLSAYWRFLERGIRESEKVIIFGYSGNDSHLNQALVENTTAKGLEGEDLFKPIIIVEWEGNGNQKARESYWNGLFHRSGIRVIRLSSILDFTDWATV